MIKYKRSVYKYIISAEGDFVMNEAKISKGKVKIVDSAQRFDYISDSDAEMDERAIAAVRAAISKAEVCKKPIARYDEKEKRAYIEYPNGSRNYVR